MLEYAEICIQKQFNSIENINQERSQESSQSKKRKSNLLCVLFALQPIFSSLLHPSVERKQKRKRNKKKPIKQRQR